MSDIKNIKVVDAEVLDAALNDLAESIRTKSGVQGDLAFPDPNEFKSAVDIIDTVKNETKPETIKTNGNHQTDSYSHVDVEVEFKTQSKTATPSQTIQTVEPDSGYDGLESVTVDKIPSDYIKISDTKNYTTQFKSNTFSISSDTLVSNVSITVGFKPKIFVIRSNTGITSTSSRYYITTSWVVTDNNYEHILSKPDGTNDARSAGSIGFYYSSSSARSAQSNSVNNSFQATDNGVKGNGSTASSYYFKANTNYFWFAWG